MKKEMFLIVLAFFGLILLLLPNTSAIIELSRPNAIYNLGEKLELDFSIVEESSFEGIASLSINCGEGSSSVTFFSQTIDITKGKKLSLNVKPLTLSENKVGKCYVSAIVEDNNGNLIDGFKTEQFAVSKTINIITSINKKIFLPGETIFLNGKATKESGKSIDGAAEITFDKEYSEIISNSLFDTEIKISETIKSGNHSIEVHVKDSEGNTGDKTNEIFIQAVPTELQADLNRRTFLPSETLLISTDLYDQAGDEMNESISIQLTDPNFASYRSLIPSGGTLKHHFSEIATPGNWQIRIFYQGLEKLDSVYVEEVKTLDINILNGILYVKNTGNVPYIKEIEINFKKGNETIRKLQPISLEPGKEEAYLLTGPEGEYDINVIGENNERTFEDMLITGKATEIKIEELDVIKRNSLVKNVLLTLAFIAFMTAITLLITHYGRKKALQRRFDAAEHDRETIKKYVDKLKKQGKPIPFSRKDDDSEVQFV